MRKHCGEYLKTGFANSGRIAGSGMLYDRYDDECGGGGTIRQGTPVGITEVEEKAKKEREGSPVVTYFLEELE